MKYVILGDVHCNLRHCHNVCVNNPNSTVIQIGDLGVGFIHKKLIEALPPNFKFFVGNHDNRTESREIKNCLGDYGHVDKNIFFISGADSIDKDDRYVGVDWWPDEELTYQQAQDAIDQWVKSDAQVLLSHDLPQSIAEAFYLIYDRSLTRNLLQSMIEARKPKLVVYGHHHKSFRKTVLGTEFVGLRIDEVFYL